MKWSVFLLISYQALAINPYMKMVGRVNSMNWDGESYKVNISSFQTPIKMSVNNEMIPCLENANKAEMEVLVVIDADIPMIKSCKLYTPGLVIGNQMQAQEEHETNKATSSIKKK